MLNKRLLPVFIFFAFTLASWAQEASESQKLEPSNRTKYAEFGKSIAITDDMMLIGAPYEHLDGNYKNHLNRAGAVFCFKKSSDGSWEEFQKLVPSDRSSMDNFGFDIAIDGSKLVVGAPRNSTGQRHGAAYVFNFNGNQWVEEQRLEVEGGSNYDSFANSVDIEGNTVIIGSPTHDYDKNGALKSSTGAAYIFKKGNSTWEFTSKISAPDGAIGDKFGKDVKISNGQYFISAPHKDVKVNQESGGAVYIFNGDDLEKVQKLISPKPVENGQFGSAIDVYQTTLVVGSRGDINYSPGQAYFYNWLNENWQWHQTVKRNIASNGDYFGSSVAIYNNRVLIGMPNPYNKGKAVLMSLGSSGLWEITDNLENPYIDAMDNYGSAVAICGKWAAIGAHWDDDDKLENNHLRDAGSAFAYNHNSNDLLLGVIPNQRLCDSDTVKIPFTLFNANEELSTVYELQSSNEQAVPNNASHMYVEDDKYLVIVPYEDNYQDEVSTINFKAYQGNEFSTQTFQVELKHVYRNYNTHYICYGDSIYLKNVWRKEPVNFCDTIFNNSGCYSLNCYRVYVSDPIDTSISRISSNTVAANSQNSDSYEWVNCDESKWASGPNRFPAYTALSSGWYAVDITVNDCTARSNCYYLSNPALSVNGPENGLELEDFRIIPSEKRIFVRQDLSSSDVSVYNALGQKIYHQSGAIEAYISYDTWKSGLYILTVQNENETKSFKLRL